MMFDRPGNEGDIIGVRPFRMGDRLRSIHWAQTARRDSFIVTERQAAARRLVVVAVELAAFAGQGVPRRHLETAIRVAASITQEFHSHHIDVRFVLGDIDMLVSSDPVALRRLFDTIARFKADQAGSVLPAQVSSQALTMLISNQHGRSEWDGGADARDSLHLVAIESADADDQLIRRGWINIDPNEDESVQLRQQWDRVCQQTLTK